ncbi:MAG: pentapeptide repeat-containing protein [Candidatus Dormibacteraeota bacterium]|nr:pentapeptide repeat-containing protein [Candidatus Dormibacteraeota bacterium]
MTESQATLSHATLSHATLSQATLSHATLSHETAGRFWSRFACRYMTVRKLFGAIPWSAFPTVVG